MKKEEIVVGEMYRFVIPNPRRVIAERVKVLEIETSGRVALDNPDDNSSDVYSAWPNQSTGNYDCLEVIA